MVKASPELPNALGGLEFPNYLYYYWSCNKCLCWNFNTVDEEHMAWNLDMELASSKRSLHSWVCSQISLTASNFTLNSVGANH